MIPRLVSYDVEWLAPSGWGTWTGRSHMDARTAWRLYSSLSRGRPDLTFRFVRRVTVSTVIPLV